MEIITNDIFEPVTLGNYTVQIQEIAETENTLDVANVADPLDDGQAFMTIKLAVTNNSDAPYNMTSYISMTLTDEDGNNMEQVMVLDTDRTINAEILPGEERVGEVVYAVPENGKLNFSYNPEFIGPNEWTVTVRE